MNEQAAESRTLAACLTPPAAGAIATLALRGPRAWTLVRELFHPYSRKEARLPDTAERGRFWLGRLEESGQSNRMADEVVVAVEQAEPVPWLELHCHGGPEVIRWVLEIFRRHGLEVLPWQQLLRLTEEDKLKALALTALADAPTARTAAILLDQYQGAFRRAVDDVLTALGQENANVAIGLLEELAHFSRVGRHLTIPWEVAVIGAPNVGKSSLVNAIAGYQRSVVSATPGTTRDVVTTLIAVDGWPVELSDTAGLRIEANSLEAEGIRRTHLAAASADLCLWVMDASVLPVWPALPVDSVRFIVNKVDLPPRWNLREAAGGVQVSALTGAGLNELCQSVAQWLVPRPPPVGAAVPFLPSLCDRVDQAFEKCISGRTTEARVVLEGMWENCL